MENMFKLSLILTKMLKDMTDDYQEKCEKRDEVCGRDAVVDPNAVVVLADDVTLADFAVSVKSDYSQRVVTCNIIKKKECQFTSSVGKYNPELKIYFPGIDTPTTNEGVRVSDVCGGKIREKKSLLPQAKKLFLEI